MPLHSPTISVPTFRRTGRLAALAAATVATAGAVAVITGDEPAPPVRQISVPARYVDVEANKAAAMRSLSRDIAEQRAISASRYEDIEANKARSTRRR